MLWLLTGPSHPLQPLLWPSPGSSTGSTHPTVSPGAQFTVGKFFRSSWVFSAMWVDSETSAFVSTRAERLRHWWDQSDTRAKGGTGTYTSFVKLIHYICIYKCPVRVEKCLFSFGVAGYIMHSNVLRKSCFNAPSKHVRSIGCSKLLNPQKTILGYPWNMLE